MAFIITFLFLVLLFVSVPAFLLYIIPTKLNYPKTGKYSSIAYLCFCGILIISMIFEDQLFTKNDARRLVADQGLELRDDFGLEENRSTWGIGDSYHTFTLTISAKDKQLIIDQIKHSNNFTPTDSNAVNLLATQERYTGPKQIQNSETATDYVREYFKPNGPGYAPTYRRIMVAKQGNTLVFEDIDL